MFGMFEGCFLIGTDQNRNINEPNVPSVKKINKYVNRKLSTTLTGARRV